LVFVYREWDIVGLPIVDTFCSWQLQWMAALGILSCLSKVMACCTPLDEAMTDAARVENVDEAVIAGELERAFGENPATSDG
jgi:hypothetical protein